jgi:hypothetical protein
MTRISFLPFANAPRVRGRAHGSRAFDAVHRQTAARFDYRRDGGAFGKSSAELLPSSTHVMRLLMLSHALLTATITTAAISCAPASTSKDAGAADAGSQTVGDQCAAIAAAFCTRAISGCGVASTLSDCIANETPYCCLASACQAASLSSPSAVDACMSAIASQDCNSVVTVGTAGLPACQGIPQKP